MSGSVTPGDSFAVRHASLVFCLVVGCLTFLLYSRSLFSGFVYDAEAQIVIGDYIHNPANFPDVLSFRVLSLDVLDFNRPVHLLSLMIDSLFWGRNPFGYHLTSNLLHAANAALLCLLILILTEESPGPPGFDRSRRFVAVLGALLFAFHPVNVEPVAEVTYREDLLATFFLFLALLMAVEFGRRRGPVALLCAAGCTAAALFSCASKETGIAVAGMVFLYWLLYRRKEPVRRWVVLIGCVILVTAIFLAARFALQPRISQIFLHPPAYIGGSFAKVFEIQPRIWVFLFGCIVWPLHLSADYVPQNVAGVTLPAACTVLVVFVAMQTVLAWKNRLAAMGVAMFWLGFAPVSNFLPMYRPLADRFLYLPMAGMGVMVAGAMLLAARKPLVFRGLAISFAVVGILLVPLTWQRQAVFANALNLWRDTLAKSPFSNTAACGLGYSLLDGNDYPGALNCFQKALQLTKYRDESSWAGGAIALEKMGQPDAAEKALQEAVARDPLYADPQQLVRAMLMTRENAGVLSQIHDRLPEKQTRPME